ncbi:MAG: TRAP transporter large permease [bacterium]|nr:TRAP transporter large permease [bacterium]
MDIQVLILVITFFVLMFINVPIAFCLGIATFFTIVSIGHIPASTIIAQRLASGIDSFALLAIPFFILSGILMGRGGMAKRLIDFARTIMGRFPGGLGYVNILTCMLFGSISGSATAAVSSVGGFMIPEMNKNGYDKDFNISVTATAATVGLMIPPSNIMIIYALVTQSVSVAAMFMAGILPGILVGICIMIACGFVSTKRGYGSGQKSSIKEICVAFRGAILSLLLVIIVLGGILSGVFTATEAAGVAVVYAFIIVFFVYRELSFNELPEILLQCAKTTAIVMILIGMSSAMSWVLSYDYIPQHLSAELLSLSNNKFVILIIINVLLLVVGMFMDMTPAVLVFTPLFLPMAIHLGINPIHFGMIMIVNLCIGLCTPPVGTCLFVGCSVGGSSITKVSKQMPIFILAMIVALILITFIPQISMFIPNLFGLAN